MGFALGTDALVGFVIDAPSPLSAAGQQRYNVGHPGLNPVAVTGPATGPSAAVGAAGNLTGTFLWRHSYMIDGQESAPSPPSAGVAFTADAANLTAVIVSADTRCTERRLYRAQDDLSTYWTLIPGVTQAGSPDDTVLITGTRAWMYAGAADDQIAETSGTMNQSDGASASLTAGEAYIARISQNPAGTTVTITKGLKAVAASAVAPALPTGHLPVADVKVLYNAVSTVIQTADITLTADYSGAALLDWYWVGGIYNNTGTTYTDDLSATSAAIDTTLYPKTATEVGSNFGFGFMRVNSIDAAPVYGQIQPAELTGKAGIARSFPGDITVPSTVNDAFRGAWSIAMLTAFCGLPIKTQMTGTPVYRYVWTITDVASLSLRTLTALMYKGGLIPPQFLFNLYASQIATKAAGGAITTDAVTLAGCNHGLTGVGTVVANVSTYTGKLIARGVRVDALASTQPLRVKVTSTASSGTFGIKFKVGSAASYTGSEITCYYDNTVATKKQIQGGAQETDWIEAQNEAGINLGADTGEDRAPYEIMFTGDCSALTANDEFELACVALIPSATSGAAYTGQAPRMILGPRFGAAHAYVKKAGVIVEAKTFDHTMTVPTERQVFLGSHGRFATDYAITNQFQVKASTTRRYNSREYEALAHANTRVSLEFLLQGELIPTAPGVFSAYRDSVSWYYPTARVLPKSPVSGPSLVPETIEYDVEQSNDPAQPFCVITAYSRQNWALPA